MHCQACDVILTTQESTRRFKVSGDYVDLCNKCLSTIDEDVQYSDGNSFEEENEDDFND